MIFLNRINGINKDDAVEMARTIFPTEIHDGRFWPQCAYELSIRVGKENFAYYVVSNRGRDIGITGHYPDREVEGAMWLGWFGVLPEYRRQGFGEEILKKTIRLLQNDFGTELLKLYTGANNVKAHSLYEKDGFERYRSGTVDGDSVVYFRKDIR